MENIIPNTSGIVEKIGYNAKITEIEGKKSSIRTFPTNAALTAVENKIPNVSSLAKKADCNTKIKKFDDKLPNLNKNITSDKTKHLLVKNEFKKLKNLAQFVLEEKVILKKMAHKTV